MASSYDVLGDAAEYQEWLASQIPPAAPTAETEQAEAKQQAQALGDLPADMAQIVVHMEQQHAAAVLSAYQSLQRSRQNAPPAPSDAVYDSAAMQEPSRVMADTIATASEMRRSSRSIAKWEAQQAVWARQQSSISRKMRRPVPELAMSIVRAAEWRDKKELITTLEAAIPWTQRGAGGADIWPLQLRDNWTRHVPLGNLFSGLFVEIKEKTNAEQAAKVRRRSWASSEYLAQRLEKFSGYLKETQPHKPEAVAVTGNPVGPSHFSEDITLDDVAASLRLEQGEVAAALIKARDSLQEQARLQQQKEAKQAAAAAAAEAAERAKPKGPLLELSGQRLLFECASETWVLHTHPSTPQGPHHVTLRGAAVGPNVLGRERRKVFAMLAEKEKSAKVEGALERILADVKPPPHAVPVWDEVQQHQEAAFNTANAAAQPAVYFSPDVYQDLAQLYHTLQERLVTSAPPPVDPKKAKGGKQTVDQMDTTADTVKQACIQKEQQRAAATAPVPLTPKGGKAAAAAAPAPPTYIDTTVLPQKEQHLPACQTQLVRSSTCNDWKVSLFMLGAANDSSCATI
ncbi:hypothetical protein WJX79_007081 [Trebouxia sp. C0005]